MTTDMKENISILNLENGLRLSSGKIDMSAGCHVSSFPKTLRMAVNDAKDLVAIGLVDGGIKMMTYPDFRPKTSLCPFERIAGGNAPLGIIQGLQFIGKYLIVLRRGGELAIIDTKSTSIINKITIGKESFGLHVHPSRTYVAMASHAENISLFRVSDLSLQRTFRGHVQGILALSFSHDGHFLASAGLDGTARVWETETARPVAVFREHTGPLNDIAFSADDKEVVTASEDGTVRIWDPRTGQPVQPPEDGHLLRPVVSLSENEWKFLREAPLKSPQESTELIQLGCRLLHYQPEYPAVASICTKFMIDSSAQN